MQASLHFFAPRLGLVMLALWLAVPASLSAQSSQRRHHLHPAREDRDATPPPSPTPSRKKTRQKFTVEGESTTTATSATPVPTASPATKKADLSELSDKNPPAAKSSSADEVAPSKSGNPATKTAPSNAAVSTIEPSEIEGFEANSEPVRKLLTAALDLTRRNLTYTYGSTDPASGGMDCSGTIYYLLNQAGFTDVPRQANEQYDWVRSKSHFYAVLSKRQDNFELREMRPGDLLFWTGTYRVDRDPPVTHTMIYLGKRKKDGRRLMVGSSDGRPYDGQKRNGVSVFDFKMPAAKNGDAADAATSSAPDNAPDFSGYGPIPGMTDLSDVASRQTTSAKAPTTDQKTDSPGEGASPTPAPKGKKARSTRHSTRE